MKVFNVFKKDARKAAASMKIDRSTEQVLDLETQKKRLEMEIEQIRLDLENQKKRETMKLEEESHKHRLRLQEEKAVFDREKKVWEVEKKEMVDRFDREKKEFQNKVEQEFSLKTQEAVTLTKLESQQKIKQAEIDKERAINTLTTKHAEELTGLAIDEIEAIVGRFTKTSHRSGSLRGELIVYIDGSTAIRHHFNKKILWSSDGGIND